MLITQLERNTKGSIIKYRERGKMCFNEKEKYIFREKLKQKYLGIMVGTT